MTAQAGFKTFQLRTLTDRSWPIAAGFRFNTNSRYFFALTLHPVFVSPA
jgi:hypothetical protein